jgi:shikimate 5-dehydrogenase
VELAARRPESATRLAQELRVGVSPWPPRPGWDLLVNATPVGTWPNADDSPLDRADLRGRLVYDLVYNPLETRLLKDARAAGIETVAGVEMLVAQACRQIEWWTGHDAPTAAVERGALEFLGGQV